MIQIRDVGTDVARSARLSTWHTYARTRYIGPYTSFLPTYFVHLHHHTLVRESSPQW